MLADERVTFVLRLVLLLAQFFQLLLADPARAGAQIGRIQGHKMPESVRQLVARRRLCLSSAHDETDCEWNNSLLHDA